ncbi:transposase [Kitasatospora cineracea]|uniref:Transposase n=1 Tax=Kitasatospora cineracea TaxID=88074 RepID=A0A8G1UH24_9ACTN|nr:transposase [Kitasatospora cineracea]
MIDAIAWKFQTGLQWVHLLAEYGSWKAVYTRLRNWAITGTWGRVFTALLAQTEAEGDLDWVVSVDSTIVRAPERGRCPSKGAPADEPAHHAIGHSRGGLTTKIHFAADGRCRPLCFHLTPGQAGDALAFEHVMATLRVPRPVRRPRTRPLMVLADRAYSSRAIRKHLRRRKIRAVIPQPADRIANSRRKGRLGGRPPAFDRGARRQHNTVERCINRPKNWRALATRYEKTATVFQAGLHIAGILIWPAR